MPKRKEATASKLMNRFWLLVAAGLGGFVAAVGWLPPHRPLLLIAGLVVIFIAVDRSGSRRWAVTVAFLGSATFFAIANFPLASAHTWGGWVESEAGAVRPTSWWLMHGLWLLITLWCSLFWTSALMVYRWTRDLSVWLRVLVTAFGWVFLAEWLRSLSHWGFEWGFVGFALADSGRLRPWASVGGVLLLGAVLVAAAVVVTEALRARGRQRIVVAAFGVVVGAMLWGAGSLLGPGTETDATSRRVAAFQFSPGVPAAGTAPLGVAPDWFRAIPGIAERGYDLIVLPESISSQAVQLDGTSASHLGAARQVAANDWQQALAPLFESRPDLLLALGVEGVEAGESYNTTLLWGQEGLLGWQHKVFLVPFSEYLPRGWGFLRSQALTYYRAGSEYRTIATDPLRIGSFICQEVQHASTMRALVRDGANLLISGGNDGVFADRRVALIHHSMAQVRAAEAGRYLVRAMKSGVTSIIGPDGEVLGRSPGEGSTLVGDDVELLTGLTLWARLGPWPAWLGALGLGWLAVRGWRRRSVD